MHGKYERTILARFYVLSICITSGCLGRVPQAPCTDNLPLPIAFTMPTTGSCYFFTQEALSLTITEAAMTCEGVPGGHIVFYETKAEQVAVETEITSHWGFLGKQYWLGLSSDDSAWYWMVWRSGYRAPVTFTNWTRPPHPNSYVVMKAKKSWVTASASESHFVLCEIDSGALSSDGSPGRCPPGLLPPIQFVSEQTHSCYFGERRGYSITSARYLCESVTGAHVVFVESSQEMRQISSKLREFGGFTLVSNSTGALTSDQFWLGMEKDYMNDGSEVWKWKNTAKSIEIPVSWTVWYPPGSPPYRDRLAALDPLRNIWAGKSLENTLNVLCEIDNFTTPDNAVGHAADRGYTGFFDLRIGMFEIDSTVNMSSVVECVVLCSYHGNCRGIHFRVNATSECVLLKEYTENDVFNCGLVDCYIKTL